MNISIVENKALTMSSREIAELTGKRHDHVLRDIQKMIDNPNLGFAAEIGFYSPSGASRSYKQFLLPRRSCDLLVMSYSVEIQAKMYDRWQELEAKQAPRLPQTFAEALQLAADQAKQLELQAPKVAFVDNYVESSGNKTFREVAKLLKANERQFRSFMVANKIQYVLNGSWAAYQNHIDAGRFTHKTGEKNGHAYTECRFTPKGIQWISNLWENK